MQLAHLEILQIAAESGMGEDAGGWSAVFDMIGPYVFVALCDADCCDLSIQVRRFSVECHFVLNLIESESFGTELNCVFRSSKSLWRPIAVFYSQIHCCRR